MKKAISIIFIMLITLCSCGISKTDSVTESVGNFRCGEKGTKALYIYMCGSTLESRKGSASKNIAEILEADISDDTTVIIETGGTKKWKNYDISSNGISRYEVKNHELSLLENLGQSNMGDENTFESFLNYCTENYPAEEMSVILWDHGSGSVDGVCYDENYGMDSLTLAEIDSAFAKVKPYLKDKFEFVGFDACLMANMDVAAVVEKYADYMVASEELEPAGGWDYKTIINSLGDEKFYDQVLQGYAKKCESKEKNAYTLSVINMERFQEVRDLFLEYVDKYMKDMFKDNMQQIVINADNSMKFGYYSGTEGYSNLIDLVDFMKQSDDTAMESAVDEMISTVNGTEKTGACGMSIYYPLDAGTALKNYAQNSSLTDYSTLLASYYTDKLESDCVRFTDTGSDVDGELHIKLDEQSKEYVKKVVYRLYRFDDMDDEMTAYCMGYNTSVISDGKNGYTTSFGGEWFSLNGTFINCVPIYNSGSITAYSTPVMCDGEQGTIRFTYDADTREVHVEGFLPEKAENGAVARLENIQDKTQITIEYDDRTDSFTENLKQGETYAVKDGVDIKPQTFEDGLFVTYLEVMDIYGNVYHSDSAILEMVDNKLKVYELVGDLDYSKL